MNKTRKKGYLMLEAVVSIAVVAIGLAVILRSFAASLRASKVSHEYFVVTSLLNDAMSDLEERVKLNEKLNKPGLDGSEAKSGEIMESSGIKYALDIEIEPLEGLDYLASVRSAIYWDNGKRKERIQADTFLRYESAP
jgi:type II secretory pathway pseudopilin PulG